VIRNPESNNKMMKKEQYRTQFPGRRELQKLLRRSNEKLKFLQKELDIEAAFQQVRLKSMAMHKSEQLPETARVLFEQFGLFGIFPDRMSIGIINEESKKVELWVTDQHGNQLNDEYFFSIDEPTSMAKIYSAWKEGEKAVVVDLSGQNLQRWLHFVKEEAKLPVDESGIRGRRVQQAAFFSQGFLLITTHEPVGDEIIKLLVRFAGVFDLAYTRFRDLLKAEGQALDAIESKKNIEAALMELKATQAQLIRSEEMASLGELTAGIAHEIQNPLNFVNNFSEVNRELIAEMKQAMTNGNTAAAISVVKYIESNEDKINFHGKRAEAIVKSMLQHSQASLGKTQLTDINALADEYFRISYHGARAKDNHFNVVLKTDFDDRIGKINIIPKDIGRVLLNLFNNAFYAVNEKRKTMFCDFEPTVSVMTKKSGCKIEISVKDNGPGISQKVMDKIFQPFYTTKPAGQGTGLGLSLSYEIVKKHGGEWKVDSKEGEYTEFTIQLPLNKS
jgi:signal transduction histidine kinase